MTWKPIYSVILSKTRLITMPSIKDITGLRVGKLVAQHSLPKQPQDQGNRWLCRCDCGNTREVSIRHLRPDGVTACRDCSGKVRDLRGQKFGHWTVLSRVGRNRRNKALWLCKCDCGTERLVVGSNLVRDVSKSCGCSRTGRPRQHRVVPYVDDYRLSPESRVRREQIILSYEKGETMAKIAKSWGISKQRVNQIIFHPVVVRNSG